MSSHRAYWFAAAVLAILIVAGCGAQAAPTTAPPTTTPSTPAAAVPTAPQATTAAGAPTAAPTKAPATGAQTPKSGGKVVVAFSQEPDRMWSPFTGLVVSTEVGGLINLTLIGTNEKNDYIPLLLSEVPSTQNGGISTDSLTWTLHLRQNVKWHDGQPFTSADVKFTYDTIVLPGTDVVSRVGWSSIASVDTPDDHTVVIKFKDVYAPFLSALTGPSILPKHILGGLTAQQINAAPWFRAPVGTGPFMFKEWVAGDHITVVKNPNYFIAGQPYLDQITYRIVPDANTLLNMTETGDVDLQYRVTNDLAGQLDHMSNVTRSTVQSLTPWLLYFNINRPVLNDARTRQALSYGFDKAVILKQVFLGLSERADGPISPQLWAYNPEITVYNFDQGKAKALLDAAGWTDIGSDGIRKAKGVKGVPDGTPLKFEIGNISGEQIRIQVLSIIAAQWKSIGVQADIHNMDVATMFGKLLPANDFDMTYSFIGRNEDPDIGALYLNRTKYSNRSNYGDYQNAQVDDLILQSQRTADRDKRKAALSQAEKIISDEVPQIFLAWRANTTAVNKRLHGYKTTSGNNEMWNAAEWWVD